MKTLAVLLSALISLPALGQPLSEKKPQEPAEITLPPLIITAPRPSQAQISRLKGARAAGGAAAVSGTGLLIYSAVAVGAGPIGWAAGLMFFGGLAAYLAHRRLHAHDDFGPTNAEPATTVVSAVP